MLVEFSIGSPDDMAFSREKFWLEKIYEFTFFSGLRSFIAKNCVATMEGLNRGCEEALTLLCVPMNFCSFAHSLRSVLRNSSFGIFNMALKLLDLFLENSEGDLLLEMMLLRLLSRSGQSSLASMMMFKLNTFHSIYNLRFLVRYSHK